ncbi:hypothetical protein CRG98_042183 [Punica granatum]|uniref:F-box associated beta-propeller type 1 domain-containing protein n=1 Tax=Punica granatum TaxID=22663 RepID=A0A2I0I0A4_PUNGR|nr:hypothetical protein CRG98_042183 [Punica granatum]
MTGSAGAENHRITILRDSYLQKLYSAEMEPPYRVRELPRTPMRVKLVGSCNGLLCLASSFSLHFLLWNPLTNSRARLPLPGSPRRESVTVGGRSLTIISWANDPVFGFGYDSVKEDYKVVIIDHEIREGYQDIRVYSSRRNSWRRFRDERYKIYCLLSQSRMGVYACNNLHWVMTRRSDSNETRLIVAFDLSINNYREVPLPFYLGKGFWVEVAVLGGCLGMVVNSSQENVSGVWIMREYGSRESWVKLLPIPWPEFVEFGNDYNLHPSNSGGTLLVEGNFHWFDAKSQCFRSFKFDLAVNESFDAAHESFVAEVCVGSLVGADVHVRTQTGAPAAAAAPTI